MNEEDLISHKKIIYNACVKKKVLFGGTLKKGYERIIFRAPAFDVFKDKTVIDFGCHIGIWSFFLSQFAKKVIGIDHNHSCIQRSEKVNSVLEIPNIVFLRGDANSLGKICEEYNANALFSQKTLGSICKDPKDYEIFHDTCNNYMDIIVSDYNFQVTQYKWIKENKFDNLYVFTK